MSAQSEKAAAQCLECGHMARPVTGEAIYPHRPDLYDKQFYLCQCGAYCGAHKADGRPLGHPSGAATRCARMDAHKAFDRLWKDRFMRRSEAYEWLSRASGIDPINCHIGKMTADQARRVTALATAKLKEMIEGGFHPLQPDEDEK